MNKNDLLTIEINDMNSLGYGVGKTSDGKIVFVNGAIEGDFVRAKVIKAAKSYLVAHLEEIISPSVYRTKEEYCPSPNSCGGCTFRNICYERELEIKRGIVKGEFIKHSLANVEVAPVRFVEGKDKYYRNKAQFPVGTIKGKVAFGIYSKRSHDIVKIDSCSLLDGEFVKIAECVCDFANENSICAYDEKTDKGLLRHIFVRKGFDTNQIMLCLVLRSRLDNKIEKELAKKVTDAFPNVVSVMVNLNTEKTNVIMGEKYYCIFGKDYIEDRLLGKHFRIGAPSFYQINRECAQKLYSFAGECADLQKDETLLDLYCGAGTIGLCLCDKVKTLVGIEIVREAIECAKKNAEQNNVNNAHFFCADAQNTEKLLENAENELGKLQFDKLTVIMDPPAKGSTPELIEFLAKRNVKKIVYISCGPDTLARDCALFAKLGYSIGKVTPFDMFPRTGHIESVVVLTKGK